ncbi:MAG: hypothetical protein ABI870_02685 [Rhodanobacter sp.]
MIATSRKFGISLLGSLALVVGLSGAVAAQDMPASGSSSMSSMKSMGSVSADHSAMKGKHGHMMGMHMMPATVNAVDASTGVVDVTAGGMALKVHFPPAAEAGLKAGDKITLHLGYSKP